MVLHAPLSTINGIYDRPKSAMRQKLSSHFKRNPSNKQSVATAAATVAINWPSFTELLQLRLDLSKLYLRISDMSNQITV